MNDLLQRLAQTVEEHNSISPEMFSRYNVKRGLRNDDGTGVLVGITEISSVHGYIKDDEEVIPDFGKLYYRGVDVEDLVEGGIRERRFTFEETAYLLLAGTLPTNSELEYFSSILGDNRALPKNFVRDILSTFRTSDIMNALARSVLTLYSFDNNPDDTSLTNVLRQGVELISRVPKIVAYAYRVYLESHKGQSLIIHPSSKENSLAENFLRIMSDNGQFDSEEARILDAALVLHADHGGGNNSTFANRVVTSSGTDTYSAIAASLGSLKGPLHGGANGFVMTMMDDIKANVTDWSDREKLRSYIIKLLKGEAGNGSGKIYGFGHAVYTLSDPRAVILKKYAAEMATKKNRVDEFGLYTAMEQIVPEVFSEVKGINAKTISPNVDFYSGFVYDCMDIPREVYTPLFAVARTVGWIAHRIEEILVQKRIIRPAYKNVTSRQEYIPLDDR